MKVVIFAVVRSTLIYPATDKHVQKYRKQKRFVFVETPDLYENVIKPFIKENQFSTQVSITDFKISDVSFLLY